MEAYTMPECTDPSMHLRESYMTAWVDTPTSPAPRISQGMTPPANPRMTEVVWASNKRALARGAGVTLWASNKRALARGAGV